jgi:hypothetical protein
MKPCGLKIESDPEFEIEFSIGFDFERIGHIFDFQPFCPLEMQRKPEEKELESKTI